MNLAGKALFSSVFCDRCALNQPYYVVAQEEQMTSLGINAMLVWCTLGSGFARLGLVCLSRNIWNIEIFDVACFFLPCLPNTILWPCIAISYNSLIWAFNVADETIALHAPTFSHYEQNLHFCSIRCSSAFDEGNESKKKGKLVKGSLMEKQKFVPILKLRTLKMHHMKVDMQGDQFFFTIVLIVAWSHDFDDSMIFMSSLTYTIFLMF